MIPSHMGPSKHKVTQFFVYFVATRSDAVKRKTSNPLWISGLLWCNGNRTGKQGFSVINQRGLYCLNIIVLSAVSFLMDKTI